MEHSWFIVHTPHPILALLICWSRNPQDCLVLMLMFYLIQNCKSISNPSTSFFFTVIFLLNFLFRDVVGKEFPFNKVFDCYGKNTVEKEIHISLSLMCHWSNNLSRLIGHLRMTQGCVGTCRRFTNQMGTISSAYDLWPVAHGLSSCICCLDVVHRSNIFNYRAVLTS